MRRAEAKGLPNGLYRLHWKSGGFSLAAVGRDNFGVPWFAPTNWLRVPDTRWSIVKRVERLELNVVDRLAELAGEAG